MAWTERYVSTAGGGAHDGTTEADAWTLAEAIAAPYAAGQRINVKAGTYANTTTDRTFGAAGSTTAPIWWRGYNTAIGDLDADFTTAKPAITFTTGGFLVTAAHQMFSNFNISGARTAGPQVNASGGNLRFHRCRIENTGGNAASNAISVVTNVDTEITSSWLKAGSSATRVINMNVNSKVIGCVFEGGGHAVDVTAAIFAIVVGNVMDNNGGHGLLANTAGVRLLILSNSIYSPGTDGIRVSAIPTLCLVANNIFEGCAVGINNSTGTNMNLISRHHNAFYNSGTSNEAGFGDAPAFNEIQEVASPFTNAAGHDFSLLSTSLSRAAGMPGLFESQSYTSYLDIGAVQRQEPAGGGGLSSGIFKSPIFGG